MPNPLAGISCVGYCRVSTDRQAGETQTSLEDQCVAIKALAAKLNAPVGRWYRDEGASGATVTKRPALRQLLADCENSPRKRSAPGYVLVLNDSRWGRFPNPDQAAALRFRLEEVGWLVRLVEGDDSENVSFRHVMRAIGGAQASEHRAAIQRNARRGSRGTAEQGFWGTRTPYGYDRKVVYPRGQERILRAHQRKAPGEKVILIPNAEAAAVVRETFERYATGTETLATLTIWLRERESSRKWTRAAVRYTLSNPAYVGDVVSGRVPGDKDQRAVMPRRPEAEWVVRHAAHEAIVPEELFHACQQILARNGRWKTRVRTDWLLSGVVLCRCGKPYVAGGGNYRGGRTVTYSYRCVTKAHIPADRCAYPGAVKKEWMEDAVLGTLSEVVGSPSHRRRLLAHLDAALAETRREPGSSLGLLEKQIASAAAMRDRLVAAVADGTLVGDEAKGRLDAVRRQLARLEAQRDSLARDAVSDHSLDSQRDRLAALCRDFRAAAKTLAGPALREIVRPWIASAVFDSSARTLTIEINTVPDISYGVLNQMPFHPCVRRRARDSRSAAAAEA